jgi:hypothetical protein
MQKRGALELSVNTIVIVVIGVALLSLGLIFVRQTFGGLTDMSKAIFGTADIEITKLQSGSKFTVPTTVNVKQGQVVRQAIHVGHTGDPDCPSGSAFSLKLGGSPTSVCNTAGVPANTICAKIISSNSVTLKAGEEGTFVIAVAATKNAPLSTGTLDTADFTVPVDVYCGSGEYDHSAFTINVMKGGGLFS